MKIFKILITIYIIIILGLTTTHFWIKTVNSTVDKTIKVMKANPNSYFPKLTWDYACWHQALMKLFELELDPEVTGAQMILGNKDMAGHAWISYVKNGEVIKYDPAFDYFIEEE